MLHLWHWLWTWFAIHTGTYNESGPYYGFFSGFGSDISEIAILGGLILAFKHHNCAVHGCLRISRRHYAVKGTAGLRTCHKHYTEQWHKLLLKEYIRDNAEQNAWHNHPDNQ